MGELNISERQSDIDPNVTILDLKGKITIGEGAHYLRSEVRRLLREGKKQIILNCNDTELGYIDSSGIGELLSSFTAVNKEGGKFKLLNISQKVQDLLALMKFLTFFDRYTDETEAVKSFTAS